VKRVTRYSEVGQEVHGRKPGSAMTVEFELDGQRFTALNGGPLFTFNESISFTIRCETQEEVDHYWNRLSEGGDPKAQQCGWLKDKFGVSWQVVPAALDNLIGGPDPVKGQRAFAAMMKMKKLVIADLQRAYDGN
jgi:predicted 3-demethylubiquinone-9 3-methyltransferase (glyoxalase superfamily)